MRDRSNSVPIPCSPTLRFEKSLDDPNKFLAGLDMRVVPGLRDALRPGVREPGIEPVEILLPNKMGTPPVNQESRRIDGRPVRVGEPGEFGKIAPEAFEIDLPAEASTGVTDEIRQDELAERPIGNFHRQGTVRRLAVGQIVRPERGHGLKGPGVVGTIHPWENIDQNEPPHKPWAVRGDPQSHLPPEAVPDPIGARQTFFHRPST